MSKNTFSQIPTSALTVNRRQDASTVSMGAANDAINRMVVAGLSSGCSFKATVTASGGSVSASFRCQNAQRQAEAPRPQTARPAIPGTPIPSVHQLPIHPTMTPRPTVAATAKSVLPPPACRYFAAGFCNKGHHCHFSHGVVQQAPRAPAVAQLPITTAAIPNVATATGQHQKRPSSAAGPTAGGGLAAGLHLKLDKQIAVRPPAVPAPPPREMNCLICMDSGMSNQGVVCSNGHFFHRACLDQLATHSCNEYLTHGPCKSSFVPCPYNNNRCCLFTPKQLRRGGVGASASCIALLDRVAVADAELKKLPVLEQLRRTNQDAYMCPQCSFGPVAHFACPNLGGAPQTNRCPKCSYFAADIGGWRKWDGTFAAAV